MKKFRLVSVSLSLMSCLGMLLPQAALAELTEAAPQVRKAMDVSLHPEGLLVGQVVTPQGIAKSGVTVSLTYMGRELARTKTDKLGRFAVKGLKGGTYKLATASSIVPIRVWTRATAPPRVAAGALLVEGMTVRGQYPTLAEPTVDVPTMMPNSTTYYVGGEEAGTIPPEPPVPGDTTAPMDATAPTETTGSEGGQPQVTGSHPNGSYGSGSVPYGGQAGYYGGGYHGGGYHGAVSGAGSGGGLRGGILSSPVLVGAGIAAAIAIPIAVSDDDDDDAS